MHASPAGCSHCKEGVPEDLKPCPCLQAFYCNRECQLADWETHIHSCTRVGVKEAPTYAADGTPYWSGWNGIEGAAAAAGGGGAAAAGAAADGVSNNAANPASQLVNGRLMPDADTSGPQQQKLLGALSHHMYSLPLRAVVDAVCGVAQDCPQYASMLLESLEAASHASQQAALAQQQHFAAAVAAQQQRIQQGAGLTRSQQQQHAATGPPAALSHHHHHHHHHHHQAAAAAAYQQQQHQHQHHHHHHQQHQQPPLHIPQSSEDPSPPWPAATAAAAAVPSAVAVAAPSTVPQQQQQQQHQQEQAQQQEASPLVAIRVATRSENGRGAIVNYELEVPAAWLEEDEAVGEKLISAQRLGSMLSDGWSEAPREWRAVPHWWDTQRACFVLEEPYDVLALGPLPQFYLLGIWEDDIDSPRTRGLQLEELPPPLCLDGGSPQTQTQTQ
eukprot:Rhum_TRINITY_DN14163_c29_g1::Rhum_TRINITY_DN14163_c29_g1_i1::g.69538::m.69538